MVDFNVKTVHSSAGSGSVIADAKKIAAATREAAKAQEMAGTAAKKKGQAEKDGATTLAQLIRRQETINRIMKETGVSATSAGRAVRAFGANVDRADKEAAQYAAALDRAQRETRELARAQAAASKTGGSHLVTVQNLHRAYAALAGVVGVGVLARGILHSVEAFENQSKVAAQVEARLRSTGNAVGITSREIADFAGEWQRATGIADEETQQLAASLIPFTGIVRESFNRVLSSAFDMAEVLQTDVKSSLLVLAKAAEQPERAQSILRRSGIALSDAEAALAKQFAETGQAAKAQAVILDAVEKRYGGAAKAAREAGGSIAALKTELGDFAEVVGGAVFEGGGKSVTEWATAFVRASREIIAARNSEAKSMAETSKRAQTLGEFYTLLSFAASGAAGEVHPLTTYLRNNAAEAFRASAGAAKYREELIATLAVTQRFNEAISEEDTFQKRLDKAFAQVIDRMKDEERAAKELESYIRSLDTKQDKLNASLDEAAKRFHAGEISAELYAKAIRKAVGELDKLDIANPFALLEEEGPPVPEGVAATLRRIAAEEAADLARVRELKAEIANQDVAILAKRQEIQKLYEKGKLTLEERNKLLAANVATVKVTNEELTAQQKIWAEIMDAAVKAANNGHAAWAKTLLSIADNLDAVINSFFMLGDILSKAGREDLGQLATGIGQLASGDYGGGIGSIAQGFGLTGGGFSQFGGANERNFIAEGAALGAQYGGVYGALIGAFAGAFVKGGADDLHAGLEELRGRADFIITEAQGELAEVGAQVEGVLEGFFNSLQDSLSADLDFGLAGLSFNIREDRVRVLVNNIEMVFHTIEEALAFAAQGVLAANAEAAGIGDNLRRLFENLSGPAVYGSLEDLQAAIDKARELDFEETGVTGEYIKARERALAIGRQYNMDLAATLALEDKRIAAQRRSLEAEAASVFGIEDVFGRFSNLAGALTRFDAEMAADHDSRVARLEEIRAQLAAMAATADDAVAVAAGASEATEGAAGALRGLREGGIRAGEGLHEISDEMGPAGERFSEGAREIKAARESVESLNAELAALEASLEGGAEAFGADEISKIWTTAVDQVAVNLAQMIDSITGRTGHVAELEEIRNRQTTFALLAQIQQAQLVRATVEGVSVAVLAMLDRLIAEGQSLLEGLASGDVKVPAGGIRPGGGGASRREQAKREAEEEARRAAEEQERMLDTLRTLTEEWTAAGYALRDTDLGAAVRDLAEKAQEDLAAAAEAAAADPAAYDRLRAQIEEGLQASMAAIGRAGLDALDSPLRSLAQSFRETRREILYMISHADELGLTLKQVGDVVRQAVLPGFLDSVLTIANANASTADGAALAAQAAARKTQIERALFEFEFRNQILLLETANAMTPALREMADNALALLDTTKSLKEEITDPDPDNPFAGWTVQAGKGSNQGTGGGGGGGGKEAAGETLAEIIAGMQRDAASPMERLAMQFEDMMDRIGAATGTAEERALAAALAQESYNAALADLQEQTTRGLRDLIEEAQQAVESRKAPVLQLSIARTAFEQAQALLDLNDAASVQALEQAASKYLDIASWFTDKIGGGSIFNTAQEAVAGLAGLLPGAAAPPAALSSPFPFAPILSPTPTFLPGPAPIIAPAGGGFDTSKIEARLAAIESVLTSTRTDGKRYFDAEAPVRRALIVGASGVGR